MYQHIVIVDDSKFDRVLTKQILTINSFAENVSEFSSGMDALEYLKTAESFPEMILLGLEMPIMDGFGFLLEYSKLPTEKRKDCKLVVLPQYVYDGDISHIRSNTEVVYLLSKPFTADKFRELESKLTE